MRSRDEDPFAAELVSHVSALRRYAISLCRDDVLADDLVQATVNRALEFRNKFELGTNMAAWLFTILRNVYFSLRRRMKLEAEDPEGARAAEMISYENPQGRMEFQELLELVHQLPPHFREPILMLADGMSYEEVAAELMEHPGTIKSRVHRGRQMLMPVVRAALGR